MPKDKKFPKTIYVRWMQEPGGTTFLLADEKPCGEHRDKIAIYKLTKVKTLRVTETLE